MPVEAPAVRGEQADTEGRRAADAIKKNTTSQRRRRYEVSAAVSGARAPERPIGPAPTSIPPTDGTSKPPRQQTNNRPPQHPPEKKPPTQTPSEINYHR